MKPPQIKSSCPYCQFKLVPSDPTDQPYGRSTISACPRCGQYATERIEEGRDWQIQDTEGNVLTSSGEYYNRHEGKWGQL